MEIKDKEDEIENIYKEFNNLIINVKERVENDNIFKNENNFKKYLNFLSINCGNEVLEKINFESENPYNFQKKLLNELSIKINKQKIDYTSKKENQKLEENYDSKKLLTEFFQNKIEKGLSLNYVILEDKLDLKKLNQNLNNLIKEKIIFFVLNLRIQNINFCYVFKIQNNQLEITLIRPYDIQKLNFIKKGVLIKLNQDIKNEINNLNKKINKETEKLKMNSKPNFRNIYLKKTRFNGYKEIFDNLLEIYSNILNN